MKLRVIQIVVLMSFAFLGARSASAQLMGSAFQPSDGASFIDSNGINVYNRDSMDHNVRATFGLRHNQSQDGSHRWSFTWTVRVTNNGLEQRCWIYAFNIDTLQAPIVGTNATTSSGSTSYNISLSGPDGFYAYSVLCKIPRDNGSMSYLYDVSSIDGWQFNY